MCADRTLAEVASGCVRNVEFFEIGNKISATRQHIKHMEYHYENFFLPNYEKELQFCEQQWGVFSLAIEPYREDEAVKKVYEEFGEDIEDLEVKNMIFKSLRHKVNM
mgnify:CR=1 FL=1